MLTWGGTVNAQEQSVVKDVVKYVEQGDAASLSRFFNDPISIKIKGKEEIYSVDQARVALKKFFSDHPPTSFKQNHHSNGDDGKFVIGTYQCAHQQTFRIYFLLKEKKQSLRVFQFFIEQE